MLMDGRFTAAPLIAQSTWFGQWPIHAGTANNGRAAIVPVYPALQTHAVRFASASKNLLPSHAAHVPLPGARLMLPLPHSVHAPPDNS
jgi:hypothetical protein